jgi:gluconolactonase
MTRSLLLSVALLLPAVAWAGESPVDRSVPLETIATGFGLCDGPAWDGVGTLYFPDVKGEKLYSFRTNAKEPKVIREAAGRISAAFYNHGRLYLSDNGNGRMLVYLSPEGNLVMTTEPGMPPARPNDLVVDNQEGIYYTLTKEGQVVYYAFREGGERRVVVESFDTPNGLILSPDEKTLYVASYAPKKIWAYDVVSPGRVANGRVFATMDDGDAKGADGMTIDRAGNVYCAGASDIWIWSPSGELLDKLACPDRPINCTFGDSDLRSLYITGMGGLLRQRMKISGRAPHPPSEPALQPVSATRPSTAVPDDVTAQLDVEYARYGDRKLLLDRFSPRGQRPGEALPAVVVVHGGGWLNGDKTKFRALTIELARRGYVAAAIEYRLGGEALFPAAIHDCNAAVRFLRTNAERYGIDPNRIGAVGGSAGAHLVGLMATGHADPALQGEGGNPGVSSRLQAAIVMAGPMEMLTGSVAENSRKAEAKSNSNVWLGGTVDELPDLYRLADAHAHITADCPPILFMVGEHDNPERSAPSEQKLTEVGVWTGRKVYQNGEHGCWNLHPWFHQMAEDMDEFFREQMK